MPYIKNELDKLKDHASDFGWELNSVEFDLDMCPDEDEGFLAFLKQHDDEVALVHTVPEYKWNKDIKKKSPEWWELWSESDD